MSTKLAIGADLNLNRLVHLALNSSPKLGIVNFNILKTFLLELLKALNLQGFEPKFSDEDAETQHLIEDAIQSEFNEQDVTLPASNEPSSSATYRPKTGIMKLPLTNERFHALEDKLNRFEQQLGALNSLPSNQQIIDKSKEIKRAGSSSAGSGPVLEIWQYTQMSKRLESNEEGITKLTSLLQELINEINEIKEAQSKNTSDLKQLSELFNNLMSRFSQIEKFKDALASLDKIKSLEDEMNRLKKNWASVERLDEHLKMIADQIKEIENKIVVMVTFTDLDTYVTWPSLETALNGLKTQLESASNAQSTSTVSISAHNFTQTTPPPINREEVGYYTSVRPGSSNGSYPSKDLQDLLAKLGTLDSRHERLREEVDLLRHELNNKHNEPMRLPDDFAQKMDDIKKIKASLEELIKNFNIETNKRMHFEKIIQDLNKELETIKNSIKELLKNSELNSNDIEALKEALRSLEDSKVDKSWLKSELERKAEKKELEEKVDRSLYDDTNQSISHLINGCAQKTHSLEEELKASSDHLLKELESKLDRLELDSLKEYVEKQLKKLKKLQKENNNLLPSSGMGMMSEDDAAGLRKQLLRFHCISCDRPIELGAQSSAVPSLPADRGIRPIQTPRPYTTYELDQIRQFQKQQNLMQEHTSFDLFATYRQCGGSHTVTMPHKRIIKNILSDQEETRSSVSAMAPVNSFGQKAEVQIQGQDGHIYKGRLDAKLNVEIKNIEIKRPQTSRINNMSSIANPNTRATSAYPGTRLASLTNNHHSQQELIDPDRTKTIEEEEDYHERPINPNNIVNKSMP